MGDINLIVSATGPVIDPIVDASGVTQVKLAVGSKALGGKTETGSWQGAASHAQGSAFNAVDGLEVIGGVDGGGLAQPFAIDAFGRLLTGHAGTIVLDSATGAGGAPTVATLPASTLLTTYVTGFSVTGLGATAASPITVTVSDGTWTLNYAVAIPAGIHTSIEPLVIAFEPPIPASAVNTPIVVTAPDFGAGCALNAVAAQGFQL
jgi:hypothetical protein